MVDRNQRQVQAEGQGFGVVDPHQHGPDEARGVGDGHGINVPLGHLRPGERQVRQARDGFHMLAGCDLRHHSAVDGVHIRLGGDGVGQHGSPVPDHRHGGLVTGGFDS